MKICVTAEGPEMDSPCSQRFGRAPCFIVYDDETDGFEAIDNAQNLNAASGAGVQSAVRVSKTDAAWVISGHIGPKAMSVLQAADVRVAIGAEGSVADALAAFRDGKLKQAGEADRMPHW